MGHRLRTGRRGVGADCLRNNGTPSNAEMTVPVALLSCPANRQYRVGGSRLNGHSLPAHRNSVSLMPLRPRCLFNRTAGASSPPDGCRAPLALGNYGLSYALPRQHNLPSLSPSVTSTRAMKACRHECPTRLRWL